MEARLAHLEGAYEQISHRLNGMDQRIDRGFTTLDQRIVSLERKLEQRMDKQFFWVLGLLLVSIILPLIGRFGSH